MSRREDLHRFAVAAEMAGVDLRAVSDGTHEREMSARVVIVPDIDLLLHSEALQRVAERQFQLN